MSKEKNLMEVSIPTNCSGKVTLEFLNLLLKLEPAQFLGVARVLSVSLLRNKADVEAEAYTLSDEEKETYIKDHTVRPPEDITSDMIDQFCKLNRIQRRNLMKIIRKAT